MSILSSAHRGAGTGGVALVVAMVLLLPVVSVVAADPGSPERWIPGLAMSDSLTGPALASGQLVDSAGRSRAGLVLAVAWPTFATLAALRDGDEVKTLALAQDKAGNDGHFTLRADPAIPISEYTEEDGTLTLDIYAEGAESRSVFATSRRLAAGGGQVRWADPKAPDATPAEIALVLGRAGAAVSDDPSTTVPAEDKVYPCPDYVKATYDQRWTAIGETYPGPSATAQFKYVNTATSTLGVGFSASGTYGSFSQSGTSTNSQATTILWSAKPANSKWFYQTTFQYKKYETWVLWPDLGCIKWGYEVRPTAFQGGVNSYQVTGPPTANYCSAINNPVTITKNQGTAVTWTNGVSISSYIGVNLSSRTGFDSDTWYQFGFSTAGRLCGSNTTYPTAAQVVGKGP
jgi:hypothetical protein